MNLKAAIFWGHIVGVQGGEKEGKTGILSSSRPSLRLYSQQVHQEGMYRNGIGLIFPLYVERRTDARAIKFARLGLYTI